jgi:carbon-monoxide dehydrogenase medium subunit
VDLNRVDEMAGLTTTDGWLEVGAMTRQATVEHAEQSSVVPLLARAVPLIGHFQIRNRGTIGGSLSHADPASELPAVALALDAELKVAGANGDRAVAAADFFLGTWTTCLEPDEILTGVRFPVWPGRCGFAIEEFAHRAGDFAVAGVACGVQLDGNDRVGRAAIGLFGMGSTPVRAPAAEAALVGMDGAAADLAEVGRLATAELDPPDDIHGSSEYRTQLGTHLVGRAVSAAVQEARVV